MERGLVPAAATGLGAGIERAFVNLAKLWPQAEREGIVSGSPDQELTAYLDALPKRVLTERQKQTIEESLIAVGLVHLLELQGSQDRAFMEAVGKTYERARREGWTKERYRDEVLQIAKRWSLAEPGLFGPIAKAFLFTAILSPNFELGRHKVIQQYPQIFPYLTHLTMDDERVRPNHQALHYFVARADWGGWESEVLPPHGWGCRCRVIEIPWYTARERNWRGIFPLGTEKLVAFRALGGQDEGFPRERFVVGSAVPVAA